MGEGSGATVGLGRERAKNRAGGENGLAISGRLLYNI